MTNRITELEHSTKPAFLPNVCYTMPFFNLKIFFENVCKFKNNAYLCKRNQNLKTMKRKTVKTEFEAKVQFDRLMNDLSIGEYRMMTIDRFSEVIEEGCRVVD